MTAKQRSDAQKAMDESCSKWLSELELSRASTWSPGQRSSDAPMRPPSWWRDGPDPTTANLGASRAMQNLTGQRG